jgi:hypothetical protein
MGIWLFREIRNWTKYLRNFAEFRGPGALWNEKQLAMWRVRGNAANNDLQKCKVPVVAVTF